MNKTNAMRFLDQHKISYEYKEYEYDESDLSGHHVASVVGMAEDEVFKTLVTRANNLIFVFCIPVNKELDLKKVAKLSEQKKLEMVHVKELLDLTGYIRGGCSPIGMKKSYPTYIDETCLNKAKIAISAGIRGMQIILDPKDLISVIKAKTGDLTQI